MNAGRRFHVVRFRTWLVVGFALYYAGAAFGQVALDPVYPVDRLNELLLLPEMDIGRPQDVYLLNKEPVAYSGTRPSTYIGLCRSESDPSAGACPTSEQRGNPTSIRLRFTERRTHLSVEVTALAVRLDSSMFGEIVSGLVEPDTSTPGLNYTFFTIVIPSSEMTRFPTGGYWEGELTLAVREAWVALHVARDRGPDVTWSFSLTLPLRDADHIQLYLPGFGDAPPLVDLALRGRPPASGPGSVLSGTQVIDACLYDGYNSQSEAFRITISDPQATGPGDGLFRVRHEAAATPGEISEEIAYRVIAPDPGKGTPFVFTPGRPETFTGTESSPWRLVRMPFNPFPVACTPWPITLETPGFSSAGKRAGRYSGTLRVEFSIPATSP